MRASALLVALGAAVVSCNSPPSFEYHRIVDDQAAAECSGSTVRLSLFDGSGVVEVCEVPEVVLSAADVATAFIVHGKGIKPPYLEYYWLIVKPTPAAWDLIRERVRNQRIERLMVTFDDSSASYAFPKAWDVGLEAAAFRTRLEAEEFVRNNLRVPAEFVPLDEREYQRDLKAIEEESREEEP